MKNRIPKIPFFIMFLILILSSHNVYGYSNVRFKNITIEDGLSQSSVQAIFQDSKGYIWMGTNDGLNKYNGNSIKVYKSDDDSENHISDNYILNITEDHNGYLWISTCYGLTKINVDDGSIKNYFSTPTTGNLPHNFVNCVLVTKDNKILVGTSGGVATYDEETDSFKRILSDKSIITNQNIKAMAEDVNGNIWIGTKVGLNVLNMSEGKIRQFNAEDNNSISGNEVNSLLSDKNGNVWMSTSSQGINKININTNEVTVYKNKADNSSSLPSNIVKKMLQDKDGTIWIGTVEGLARYQSDSDNFITYTNKAYDPNSIVNDYVHSIMEDKGGLIWVGTYAGVSIFDPNNKIEHYKMDPFNSNSLSENVIHGIYEDDDGLLWVGTSANGLNIIDRENEIISHIYEGNSDDELSNNSIKVITGYKKTIWVGTGNGLNEIDRETMQIKKYNLKDGLTGDNIKSLMLDSKGYLWIGSTDGLDRLDTSTGKITNLTPMLEANGITDTYIQEIYEDKEGVYWIGTFLGGGLTKIDLHTNKVTKYIDDNVKGNKNLKSINTIRCITEDSSGNLWIGTSYGLRKFNKEKGDFLTFTTDEGLPNNTIYGILFDENSNIWVSTNGGISKLDIKAREFKNLSIIDGLQSNEFNGKSAYKGRNGELFFGGINGLNIFKPDDIVKTGYSPKVIFDEFDVQGKTYTDINDMSINYGKDIIRIKYFFPNYINNNIQYQYKLDGFNEKWITVSNNEVIYSNLAPGTYTFRIKARNQDGVMTEENKVTFKIKPPIWRTKYAILAYLVTIIIMIYMNKTKMKRLDNLVNKRTKQLMEEIEINNKLFNQVIKLEKNKNNYFINLSHELRTPLNVITSVEQLVTHLNKSEDGLSPSKLNHYMEVMSKNTKRLLNLINNIIDASKFEHGSYNINLKENNIVYVIEEAALSLKDYVESKGIELIFDTEVEEKIILCDDYEIERCVVNIVSNAAKFTPEGGKIEVSMFDLGHSVKIIISDTGIGIDEKYHKSIFDRFNQVIDSSSEEKGGSGLGLTITKHIIDLHKGTIFVESKKNEGSTFIITLPTLES